MPFLPWELFSNAQLTLTYQAKASKKGAKQAIGKSLLQNRNTAIRANV